VKTRPAAFRLAISGLGLVFLGGAIWMLFSEVAASKGAAATDFASTPARVQFEAPALELNDLVGVQHSLSDFRGQVVLVNLWATWCPPCEAEMPNLQRFYVKYRSNGFIVIAVEDGDSVSQVASFVAAHHLTFPVWLDPTYQATDRAFKTANLPTSYVLDRTGTVRWMWLGAVSEANLERYITPLIME
jgi:cytochrome c biogenesis protein CcmG/thiol:disulfide interchange protein DsbE